MLSWKQWWIRSQLRSDDEHKRKAAAEALCTFPGKRSVEPLVAALQDESWTVRKAAAKTLGTIGDPRAVDPLLAALRDDKEQSVRGMAAEALGQIKDPRAIQPLVAALQARDTSGYEDRSMQLSAATALRQFKAPYAVESLMAAISLRPDWDSRFTPHGRFTSGINKELWIAVAAALGEIGDPKAVALLVDALQDREAESGIRAAAAEALGGFKDDPRAIESLVAILKANDDYCRVKDALVRIGPAAIPPLVAALRDQDALVRMNAAEVIGKIKDPQAVEPLVAALGDDDWIVQMMAAEALGLIGDAQGVEYLLDRLNYSDPHVRRNAAVRLGKIGDSKAIEPLAAALQDQESDVRVAASEALAELGDRRGILRSATAPEPTRVDTTRWVDLAIRIGRLEAVSRDEVSEAARGGNRWTQAMISEAAVGTLVSRPVAIWHVMRELRCELKPINRGYHGQTIHTWLVSYHDTKYVECGYSSSGSASGIRVYKVTVPVRVAGLAFPFTLKRYAIVRYHSSFD